MPRNTAERLLRWLALAAPCAAVPRSTGATEEEARLDTGEGDEAIPLMAAHQAVCGQPQRLE